MVGIACALLFACGGSEVTGARRVLDLAVDGSPDANDVAADAEGADDVDAAADVAGDSRGDIDTSVVDVTAGVDAQDVEDASDIADGAAADADGASIDVLAGDVASDLAESEVEVSEPDGVLEVDTELADTVEVAAEIDTSEADTLLAVDTAAPDTGVDTVAPDTTLAVDTVEPDTAVVETTRIDTAVPDTAPEVTLDTVVPDTTPVDTAPDTTPVDTAPPVDTTTPVDTEPPVDTAPPVDTTTPVDTEPPVDTTPPVDTAPLDSGPDVPPGPLVETVTWTIRTGADGSVDDAAGIFYCLGSHCVSPGSANNWNDRDTRSVDVWHVPGGGLRTTDIDRVEIRFPHPDRWALACVQVAIDGETVHCAMTDAVLGTSGLDATADWITAPVIECETCWDGVLTHGPVVGATSAHGTRVWLRTDSGRPVALRIGTSEAAMRASEPVATGVPTAAHDFTYTFDVGGLAPATTYYYDLDVAGRRYPPLGAPANHLRTAPTVGMPSVFMFAAGSCARADTDKVPTQPAFNGLEALSPDFFLFVGDNVYFDPNSNGSITNPAGARAYYREGLQRTFSWAAKPPLVRADYGRDARADFFVHTPVWAVWDDHDFLHDNSYGVSFGVPDPNRIWARQVFIEYWPNGSYGAANAGIYSKFAWGDVDVFLVDGRYFRDIDHTTMLGDAQRLWLYDALAQSSATFKVVVDGSDWSSESVGDSWSGWSAERNALFAYLVSAHIDGVVLISGDSHRSEIKILPGADGGYPIPHIVSSGLATTVRGCPATNELFEQIGPSGTPVSSCFGADTGGAQSFVTLAVDTTLADPEIDVVIHDAAGAAQRSLTFQRSDLTFPTPNALDDRDADFDRDGYADLAIGIPKEDTAGSDDGLVQVLLGNNVGLHTLGNGAWTQASLSGTSESGDLFGAALAHGDLDGDGDDDLVVGIPGERYSNHAGTGRAAVMRGSTTGLLPTAESLDLAFDAAAVDQRFGAALAIGDFDADGDGDLAVGIPGDRGGAVRLFEGGPGNLVAGPLLDQTEGGDLTEDAAGDDFGAVLAVGDFDGDGYQDLAIGVPNEDALVANVGRVLICYGSALGLVPGDERTVLLPEQAGLALTADLHFGASLVAGDFDGDGSDDLAVGAVGAASGAGSVARFFGVSGVGLVPAGTSIIISDLVATSIATPGDALGSALAVGDFDGDGVDDLAIGAPGRLESRGQVVVRFADDSATGLDQDFTNWTVAAPGDRFGASLAAGDFDGDGYSDLAVGAPGDLVGSVARAGVVDVIRGHAAGFGAPQPILGIRQTQRWYQSLVGFSGIGGAEAQDGFGTCLSR